MSNLSEIFARDPLSLTKPDIQLVIARMREAQTQFDLGVKTPVAERKKPKAATKDLLKDLGLE